MTKKRKQSHSNHSDTLFTSKRSRPNQQDGSDDTPPAAQARIDPTYGQRGAFPGLDDPVGEDELFYGPASDGMEYLRMVRSEAKTVPNLLVAPISPTAVDPKHDLYEDYPQGYYADGAYTATPLLPSHRRRSREQESEASELDPQDAYYTSLSSRFSTLSSHLHHPPPLPANGILNIPAGFNTANEWRKKILRTYPKMGLLALLQQEMVIKGLEVLEDVITAGNSRGMVGRNVGAWAWGLLARCREVGTMGSEEVGVLRRVGKRAVWLLRRMRAGSMMEETLGTEGVQEAEEVRKEDGEEEDEEEEADLVEEIKGGDGVADTNPVAGLDPIAFVTESSSQLLSPPAEESGDAPLAEARARMLASLGNSSEKQDNPSNIIPYQQPPDTATMQAGTMDNEAIHATLDMIITIIGEFYGQRDLLDGRVLWDEMV